VYDVTGAGDTAIAVLTLALAAQAPLAQAAQLANAAAGVSVTQVGAVAVSAASIRDALAAHPDGKLLARHELAARAATWRTEGKRIVLTNGCFDLLHAGHLALLSQAAKQGDVLVLAINSDASVRRLKGSERPLVPQAERAALLAALTFVDAVTIFEEDTPLAVLEAVRPHVLVKGGDYQPSEVVGRELVEAAGGRVVIVPEFAAHAARRTYGTAPTIAGRRSVGGLREETEPAGWSHQAQLDSRRRTQGVRRRMWISALQYARALMLYSTDEPHHEELSTARVSQWGAASAP